MKKYISLIILILIVVLAGVLRLYKLDQIPPSLNWDETAAAYNAYTIANWGADEYGNKFPIVFKSFADDKHPVHIYLTAIIFKIFGVSDFTARATSAGIGVIAVIAIYFLAKKLFDSETAGLFSALFLTVSPWHIHFSRGLWENNFAFSLFILGLALFYHGLKKVNFLIPLSVFFFGLSFFSYHSAKVVVPPVVILIFLINIKKIFNNKKVLALSIAIALVFLSLVIKEPKILGFARANQTKFSSEQISKYGGKLGIYINNYKQNFTYNYLFQNGDQSPRASVKVIGEFYKFNIPFILIGFFGLLYKTKWQALSVILLWLILSPVPGALSSIDPSAVRGIFTIGPVLLLSASGTEALIAIFKNNWLKYFTIIVILIFLGRETCNYLNYYFNNYAQKEAIEWQYGMKEIVQYSKSHPEFYKIYMDKIRQQPYIFFLYYLRTPLPELLSTVKYDETESKSYNTVLSFDRYQFGGWNIIDSYPNYNMLYAITPSYYGGLRYLPQFDVKLQIKYPNKSDAFYVVSGNLE